MCYECETHKHTQRVEAWKLTIFICRWRWHVDMATSDNLWQTETYKFCHRSWHLCTDAYVIRFSVFRVHAEFIENGDERKHRKKSDTFRWHFTVEVFFFFVSLSLNQSTLYALHSRTNRSNSVHTDGERRRKNNTWITRSTYARLTDILFVFTVFVAAHSSTFQTIDYRTLYSYV